MNKKMIIGIIIVAIIIIVAAAMTLPDMLNDGSNIKLVKEDTAGYAFYSGGKEVYDYYIEGTLQNLPNNDNFEVKMVAYDTEGNQIRGVHDSPSSTSVLKYDADHGITGRVANIQSYEPLNISKVELLVYNPDGEVVFNQTLDFDMNNVDLSGLDEKPDTTTTDDDSTTISDENSTLSVDGQNINYEDVNGNLEVTVENGVYHYKGTYNGISYDYKLDKNGNPVY